mgnify:CR=1 FL=1
MVDITMKEYLAAKEIVRIFDAKLNYVYKNNYNINGSTLISHVKDLLPKNTKFDYSYKLKYTFKHSEIHHVSDLVGVTISDYKQFRNVGEKTLKNITNLYEELGIDIRGI